MTFWLSIVEKTSTFLDEMIHITPRCAMHLHGHWNKVAPLMNPSIFVDLSNGTKFCSCMCKLINDIHSHYLSCWVVTTTLAIKTWSSWVMKRLVHNEALNVRAYHRSFHTLCPLFRARAYMTFLMASCVTICWPSNGQRARCVLDVSNPCPHSHVRRLDAEGWNKLRWKCSIKVEV
jgi:hypothetical protein